MLLSAATQSAHGSKEYITKAASCYELMKHKIFSRVFEKKRFAPFVKCMYCIVFYLAQRDCFRAILRVLAAMGEGSYRQFYPNTT